jgi:uncharacterized protein YuzE
MTQITYDPDGDAAYVTISPSPVHVSAKVAPGFMVDYDAEGRIVGIELLNARKTLAPGVWLRARRAAPTPA